MASGRQVEDLQQHEYYQQIDNLETVANRLKEIPSVTGLNWGQIDIFVRRGFVEQLKFGLSAEQVKQISQHVEHVTLGIAQRLHAAKTLVISGEHRRQIRDCLVGQYRDRR